jgi:hypothetical protein
MPVQLSEDQADEMIRLLRELVELQRMKRKPRKQATIERNRAAYLAKARQTNPADQARIKRLLLGLKPNE